MQSLFVTATNTDVGKTYTTIRLIEAFSQQGFKVGVFKPIETGVTTEPLDASKLLQATQKVNPKFKLFNPKDITAYTFSLASAPFCADTQNTITIEKIMQKYDELSKLCDILLIEGAGGLFVPISKNFMMIDLIQKLKTKVLLVTPSRLGCINDTLLSIESLTSRNINFDWCVNIYQDKESFEEVTQPFYDAVFPLWWSVEKGLKGYVTKVYQNDK